MLVRRGWALPPERCGAKSPILARTRGEDESMTVPEQTARGILNELQEAVAAKDLDRLARLFTEDVVLLGTAAANLDRYETMAYLARIVAQDGIIKWGWDRVAILVSAPALLCFAVLGTVGIEDATGKPRGDRDVFRLTCVAVEHDGHWRLRHFHGSVPQEA
jgi:uncharacterized protein (TIGR02246 family)